LEWLTVEGARNYEIDAETLENAAYAPPMSAAPKPADAPQQQPYSTPGYDPAPA
jgi:hypothetical protein